MATNALQSKLNEALTTNAAGDIALRTQTEGDQTMSSLTMTGDIDGGGNYLLDDQTTTNMMSKGTVYRFDGDNDLITVADSAEIQNIFAGGGAIHAKFNANSDGETNGGVIVSKFANGYIVNVQSESGTEIDVRFLKDYGTSNGIWSVTGVKLQSENDIVIVYDTDTSATAPTMYINGTPFTPTLDLAPSGTLTSDAGSDFLIGARAGGSYAFDGEIGLVELLNFAPTAAEVKSLISGNLDFNWQYGSQTLITPSDDCAADNTGNWTDVNCALTHAASEYTMTVTTGATAASTWDEAALTVGKRYKATVLFKDGTGAGATASINVLTNAGASLAVGTPITVAAAFGKATVEWTATETNNKVQLLVAASSVGDGETVLEDIK